MSAGITAGARGAAAGLGQASAGNARELPRPRKPGLKSTSRGLETTARAAVERRKASAPEAGGSAQADRPWRAPRPKRGRVATSVRVVRLISFCAFRRSASLYLFGGETSVAFVLAAKLGREARRENGTTCTFRPRGSGGGGPLELAQRANRGGGGAGLDVLLALQDNRRRRRAHLESLASR
jgi:hypothetical protein